MAGPAPSPPPVDPARLTLRPPPCAESGARGDAVRPRAGTMWALPLPDEGMDFDGLAATAAAASLRGLDGATLPTPPGGALPDGAADAAFPRAPSYRLIRCLDAGGMGEVWEAWQDALGRRVAIKRVRPERLEGVGTAERRQALEAFAQEAAAAAALEHPNIVPIHDFGHDAEGRPLLAMKLVRGRPWVELLAEDAAVLAPAEFLARHLPVLTNVGQAIAFAHSRGIVHRDIKPGQVMLGEFGETLLMDWGLAVAFDPAVARAELPPAGVALPAPPELATVASAPGPAGTPALMAPEQTAATAEGIGPWTDVFLLGATLYYVLTGHYPHEAETTAEMMRLARAGRVLAPSLRAPGRAIPADLERLCLEAMAIDPERRVGSAREFVERLRDHQSGASRRREARALAAEAGNVLAAARDYDDLAAAAALVARARAIAPEEPDAAALEQEVAARQARRALEGGDLELARVQASRLADASARDRLLGGIAAAEAARRRRERQRRAALAASAALLALLVVAAGTFAVVVARERDRARRAEVVASDRAREAERSLLVAREQGEGARRLVEFVLRDLKGALDEELTRDGTMTLAGANRVAHQIAGRVASPVVAYFAGLPAEEWPAEMQRELAGQVHATAQRLRELGRYDEALALARRALAIREAAHDDPAAPDVVASLLLAGQLAQTLDRVDEAAAAFDRALALTSEAQGGDRLQRGVALADQASLLHLRGRFEDALATYRQSNAILEAILGPDAPELAAGLANEGGLLHAVGRVDEALPVLERALAIRRARLGPDAPETAGSMNNLGLLLGDLDRPAEAVALYEEARRVWERTLGPSHPNLATLLNNLGGARAALGDLEGALALQREALARTIEAFGPDHPAAARSHYNIAALLQRLGRADEAERAYLDSLAIVQASRGDQHPETAFTLDGLASLYHQEGRHEEAARLLEQVLDVHRAAYGPDHRRTAEARDALGRAWLAMGRLDEAAAMLRDAAESRARALGEGHPTVAATLANLATALRRGGDAAGALEQALRARAIAAGALPPGHRLAVSIELIAASAERDLGRPEEARRRLEERLALLTGAPGDASPEAAPAGGTEASRLRAQLDRWAEEDAAAAAGAAPSASPETTTEGGAGGSERRGAIGG